MTIQRTNLPSTRLAIAGLAALVGSTVSGAGLTPSNLRCEHRSEPVGVGEPVPHLSWVVSSTRRGAGQSAYQVLVATSSEALDAGRCDLWDSGRVGSDRTANIDYAGADLRSGQRCFWKVRAWDERGEVSDWSDSASWVMGLLDPEEWTADWIGWDANRTHELEPANFGGAQWIAHPDDTPLNAPAGHRMYRLVVELPTGAAIRDAVVTAVADDRFWLAVNGKMMVHDEAGWERAKPVDVADTLKAGENDIRFNVKNESDGPTGLLARLRVELEDGRVFDFASGHNWQTLRSPGVHWPTAPTPADALEPCAVVAEHGAEPWGCPQLQGLFLPPLSLLRAPFQVDKPVKNALLHVTALGLCDVYLNGERVNEEWFLPGWTDYRKRVYSRSFDVSAQIKQGENALGAELADGWFCGYVGWGRNRNHYGESPRLRVQLRVEFADGTSRTVATGPDWRAAESPTRSADFLMGETHDARRRIVGWSQPGFDSSGWAPAEVFADWNAPVEPHPGPPVVAVREFTPVSITEPEPGVYVFDLGQNFAGVARLQVRGRPGQQLRLRFAERLKPDGMVYTTNLRGALATDTFICSGEEETWTPRFTFHGFQYVELTGLDRAPDAATITGIPLSSDTQRVGGFDCSSEMLNRLVENIYWTQRSNFIDVPTDCPQRDERLGWTGDAQVYVGSACLNADVEAFFTKWLVDLRDSQREDGQFPQVAPHILAGDDGGPAWADAGVICPWTVYQQYGDLRELRVSYPSMKRFVDFNRRRCTAGLLPPAEFHCFGDWLNINADTPKEVIFTAYFAHSTRLLSRAAAALGYPSDAEQYSDLADEISAAFCNEYIDSEGVVRGDTQCGYVLALAYDLVDERLAPQVAANLIDRIEKRGWSLSTGFVGTKDLMLALAKIGRNDVACRLVHNDTFPSWGFSIRHGATSIWERWDGWTPENGFHDPGMNSFSHYSFGAVYQWMVENLAGLRNGGDAYQTVEVRPVLDPELQWVTASYNSVRGPIETAWRRTADGVLLSVQVPANCDARVFFPTGRSQPITEAGVPLPEVEGVARVLKEDDHTVAQLQSGAYEFLIGGAR